MNAPNSNPCYCHSGKPYAACCQPPHQGSLAPTALALMRSRYAAYALRLEPYLLATWHPDFRPVSLELDTDDLTKWIGLDIKQHQENGAEAIVEFIARYKIKGRAYRLHEISRFVKMDDQWLYMDGDVLEE